MRNVFYITVLSLLLSACFPVTNSFYDMQKPGSPAMKWMYDGPPPREDGGEYDPLYKEGWVHGCETGVSANTNTFYKYFNTFRQDAYKAQDATYAKGWRDAFNYCGRYIYQYNRKIGF